MNLELLGYECVFLFRLAFLRETAELLACIPALCDFRSTTQLL